MRLKHLQTVAASVGRTIASPALGSGGSVQTGGWLYFNGGGLPGVANRQLA